MNSLLKRRTYHLVIQYQMVQPENIHASNTIYPAKFINTHIYTNTHNHACIQTHIQKKWLMKMRALQREQRGVYGTIYREEKRGVLYNYNPTKIFLIMCITNKSYLPNKYVLKILHLKEVTDRLLKEQSQPGKVVHSFNSST